MAQVSTVNMHDPVAPKNSQKTANQTSTVHVSWGYFGCGPLPATVTTRTITYLVGDSYKPSFTTVTVRGPHPRYIIVNCLCTLDTLNFCSWRFLGLGSAFLSAIVGLKATMRRFVGLVSIKYTPPEN